MVILKFNIYSFKKWNKIRNFTHVYLRTHWLPSTPHIKWQVLLDYFETVCFTTASLSPNPHCWEQAACITTSTGLTIIISCYRWSLKDWQGIYGSTTMADDRITRCTSLKWHSTVPWSKWANSDVSVLKYLELWVTRLHISCYSFPEHSVFKQCASQCTQSVHGITVCFSQAK